MTSRPLLPNAYTNFKDGQLPKGPLPSGIFVFVGVGDGSATPSTLTPVNSPNDIQELFGTGPLARDLTTFFLENGGFAYAIQIPSTVVGTIGAATVGQFTAGALAGTVKNAYQVRARIAVAGGLDVAQVEFSLDAGETWGPPQVLKAGANPVKGPSNFVTGLTFSTTQTAFTVAGAQFAQDTVAPAATPAALLAAMDVAIQDASSFFSVFHVSHRPSGVDAAAANAAAISFYNDVQAKMVDATDSWFKHIYAVVQSPALTSGAVALAFAQATRAGFAGNRVQIAEMDMVIKSIAGQYVSSISPIIAARRAQLSPQNDLGIVRAGQVRSVVKYPTGWSDASVIGIDQVKNGVTLRRYQGAAGFFFTNDWMSDPTSDYKKSCFRMVADLVAADLRAAALPFVKMDVDPDDIEKSAEPLLDACRGPLKVRQKRGEIARFDLSIPSGQDILTTEELIIEVALTPIGSASWIRFNLGFKNPYSGS